MWFYTAFFTSIINAFAVVVEKKLIMGVSAAFLTWIILLLATPIIFIFALKEGVPQLNNLFFLGIAGSVLFYTVTQVMGFKAIREADLSAIYPLLSLGPIFTLFIAFLPPLSERPSTAAIVGVLITLAGIYILQATKLKEGLLEPVRSLLKNRASLLMIGSTVTNSIVVVFDKLAINNTLPKSTTFTLLIENLMVLIGLLPFLYVRNRTFYFQITGKVKLFLLLGILNAIATILAFSAVGGGNIGVVATILKTQVLFVLLLSYIIFHDKPKVETFVGTVVIIAGVILIKIG